MRIKLWLKKLETRWHNKFIFFPSIRVKRLESKVRELEAKLKESPDERDKRLLKILYEKIKKKEGKGVMATYAKKDALAALHLIKQNLFRNVGKCEKCGTTAFRLTLDHIIPKSILSDFGLNANTYCDARNFRLLCGLCNSLKAHHLDFTDPRTKVLLKEFLEALVPVDNTLDSEDV